MKNLSLILNGVLIIAVGVLYYLHFSYQKDATLSAEVMPTGKMTSASLVYINSDSLLNNYVYYKNLKTSLEDKAKKSEAELQSKSSALQNETQIYQQKAQTGAITREQAQATEEGLMKKQQQLVARKEELGRQFGEEEQKLTEQLYIRINAYLKKLNKATNYKFVFSKSGGILFANDSLDITKQVTEGLNKEFKASEK
jgi:outer membrane protein